MGASGAIVAFVEGFDFDFFVAGDAEGLDFLVPARVFGPAEEPLGEVFVFEAIRRYRGG
jgi:hypothetical protein